MFHGDHQYWLRRLPGSQLALVQVSLLVRVCLIETH